MRRIGACGDDCDRCPRWRATRSGRSGDLEAVRALWVKAGLRDATVTTASLRCHGCHPDNPCAYPELLACATRRRVATCGECPDRGCAIVATALARSDAAAATLRDRVTPDEWAILEPAFFRKRDHLGCGPAGGG